MIKIDDPKLFFSYQAKLDFIPFNQSLGWYKMSLLKNNDIKFFVDDLDSCRIAFWAIKNKIPLLNLYILSINGESKNLDIDEKYYKNAYQNLIKLGYEYVRIDSNSKYDVEFEIGLRRVGFKRPIMLFSSPLTILNHIENNDDRSSSWRRNVKIAKKSKLKFKLEESKESSFKKFVMFFNEMSSFKKMQFKLNFEYVSSLMSDSCMKLFSISDINGDVLAYRIVYVNKNKAFDIFAANSYLSRSVRGTTYLIIEHIYEYCLKNKIEYFDFGRIPPSDNYMDKIYEYKNGSRGEKIQYNGEWHFFKSTFIEILFTIYFKIIQKKIRY